MKSNEIVQEGPLDFISKVGAGIKGMASPGSTFSTGYQQKASQQQLDAYAKKSYPAWNQAIVSLRQEGIPEPQLGAELQNWATTYFDLGFKAPPFTGAVNATNSMEYLKKLWGMKISPRAKPAPSTPADPDSAGGGTTGAAGGAGTTANAAPTSGSTTATGNAAPTAGATTSSAPAQQQQSADPIHAILKDPNAFKAEWDKFIASKPNYKLIADPQLLSVLKNMWMRSGGMKAESKKNKGKRV